MLNRLTYLAYRMNLTWDIYGIKFLPENDEKTILISVPAKIEDPYGSDFIEAKHLIHCFEEIYKTCGFAGRIGAIIRNDDIIYRKDLIGSKDPFASRSYAELDEDGELISRPIRPINLMLPLKDILDYFEEMQVSADIDKLKLSFAQLGIIFEHGPQSTDARYVYEYITVPEHSFNKDDDDRELAGSHLITFYRDFLEQMDAHNVILKASIREGDTWTEEKSKEAIKNAAVRREAIWNQMEVL